VGEATIYTWGTSAADSKIRSLLFSLMKNYKMTTKPVASLKQGWKIP
jgi:hypothetical protein